MKRQMCNYQHNSFNVDGLIPFISANLKEDWTITIK